MTTLISRYVPAFDTRWLACLLLVAVMHGSAARGQGIGGGSNSVGGVAIDADGVLRNTVRGERRDMNQARARALQPVPGALEQPAELRKISLRRLAEAIAERLRLGRPLDDEMHLLAGLQDVRYVFVYPEQNDIVLAGYGEGWRADERGNVVGRTTGRAVLRLDDLIVAWRAAGWSGRGGIRCSIDPTPEGLQRLYARAGEIKTIDDPRATADSFEEALGPQVISLKGVPATSRFAHVLLAADYRMKCLGMGLDDSPVAGLPSYIQLMKPSGRGVQNLSPRWWMVADFDPLLTDGAGLAWQLRGTRVKVLTDDTRLAADGSRASAGQTSPAALEWANRMTAKYAELALREPIFAELQNCMTLAVVATLLVKEGLADRVQCPVEAFVDPKQLAVELRPVPKQTDSHASCVKRGSHWVMTVSGGVEFRPWEVVSRSENSPEPAAARGRSQLPAELGSWWWN